MRTRRHCAVRCWCRRVQPRSASETASLPRAARSVLHRLLEHLQLLRDCARRRPSVLPEKVPLGDRGDGRVGLYVDDLDLTVARAHALDVGVWEHFADQRGRLVPLLPATVSPGAICHLETKLCGHGGVVDECTCSVEFDRGERR